MNARHSTILRMRNECRTTKEMAIALNTTPRAIKASISHMRKSGIKVPIGGLSISPDHLHMSSTNHLATTSNDEDDPFSNL